MSNTIIPPLHTSTSFTESFYIPVTDPLAKRCRPHRLIETRTLQLVEFPSDDDVPPYAILSHRWEVKHEEMSYQEMLLCEELLMRPSQKRVSYYEKPGFAKICNAREQAIKEGLSYIWIDTCCIDNENHGQQSQDINSMFDYYKNSQVCYVYLSDFDSDDSTGELDMGCSMWFTRGWTLQELVAPHSVQFFDRRWRCLGELRKHGKLIASITGIPTDVVDGTRSIDDVSIKERMSWSINRMTTKEEDQAYCLLGLLGVTMEPNYAEGAQSAFERLADVLLKHYPDEMGDFSDARNGKAIMQFLRLSNQKTREMVRFVGCRRRRSCSELHGHPAGLDFGHGHSQVQVFPNLEWEPRVQELRMSPFRPRCYGKSTSYFAWCALKHMSTMSAEQTITILGNPRVE